MSLYTTALTFLQEGHKPGLSLQQFADRVKSKLAPAWERIVGAQTVTLSSGRLGNSESSDAIFVAPYDCEITAIRAARGTASGSSVTATLNNRDNAGNSDKNPLDAASIDIDGLTTADEAESQTLSGTAANLQMKAGDVLRCTFACDASSTLQGGAVGITYKPAEA